MQLKASRDDLEALNKELELRVSESTAELKNRYQELQHTYAELKSLDTAKDDFLSMVSHEFRTPLGSIQIFSEMLLKGLDTSEVKRADFLTTIINNCRRLTRLINDVLDLSKIEAGRMQFNYESYDLIEVVKETLFSLRPNFENRHILCSCSFPEGEIAIHSDKDRIIQVLTNILSNSIKFSPEKGKIVVRISPKPGSVEISIQDSGKGIRKEDIPKVFDKFTQFESITRDSVGSGLGMSISKLLVEHLGGKIWIESGLGTGTTVFFSLPLSGSWSES
ncbi:MAG TPA: HAMP domain-containing sensor histidine kinase [archaeon]|nr:HAMP domain-containing sensor histidine kinase [archaeon]